MTLQRDSQNIIPITILQYIGREVSQPSEFIFIFAVSIIIKTILTI